VELGASEDVFNDPSHPYTKALFGAIPLPTVSIERKRLTTLEGNVPSPINPPSGCHFHTRCPIVQKKCQELVPEFNQKRNGRFVACHFVE